MSNENLSVTGRIVQGDRFEARTKDGKGRALTDKQGQPKIEYFVAIAVPKTDAAMLATWAQIQGIAATGFPGGESQRIRLASQIGTGLTGVSQNRQTPTVPETTCFHTCAFSDEGNLLEIGTAGTGGRFTAAGATIENGGYFLLKKGESYIIQVTNDDALISTDITLTYI